MGTRDWGLGKRRPVIGACGAVYRRRPLAKAQRTQRKEKHVETFYFGKL